MFLRIFLFSRSQTIHMPHITRCRIQLNVLSLNKTKTHTQETEM